FYEVQSVSFSYLVAGCNGSAYPGKCLFAFRDNGEGWYLLGSSFHSIFWRGGAVVLACQWNWTHDFIMGCISGFSPNRFVSDYCLLDDLSTELNQEFIWDVFSFLVLGA